MTAASEPDPVAASVEAALTPSLTEAAAEVATWTRAMAARAANGWDFTSIGPAPDFPHLRLRSLRVLTEHAYATGEPCDGERCEDGGAAHCHRCAEVEADELLAERDRLRAESQRLDAALEEERRLIDGERRAHEARAGAAAWFLEGARQSDGTYRPVPVGEAIRQLRAPIEPQQFAKWPEDWAARRAERDAARGNEGAARG